MWYLHFKNRSDICSVPCSDGTVPSNVGTVPYNVGTVPFNFGTVPYDVGTADSPERGRFPCSQPTYPRKSFVRESYGLFYGELTEFIQH